MANLVRCDNCKRLSDEPSIGYVGRMHAINHYQDKVVSITVHGKDLCGDCVKKIILGENLSKDDSDRDY